MNLILKRSQHVFLGIIMQRCWYTLITGLSLWRYRVVNMDGITMLYQEILAFQM